MSNRNKNTTKYKVAALIVLAGYTLFALISFLGNKNIQLLNPKGIIAAQERQLMIQATLLMLIVVVPVLILAVFVVWKYRESKNSNYTPNWDHNVELEFIRWTLPGVIVLLLCIITWKSAHQLDPFKKIESNTKPITIQVVALQWKWLFIYPEQNIATVNFIEFPQNTPINFELTADAPMNSFWIPQLGGQMYAMASMSTKLHLMANTTGNFSGSAAEINGRGFAGMKFVAKSTSKQEFDVWVQSVKKSPNTLTISEYNKLAEPTENNQVVLYASAEKDLYNYVIMKFMPASPAGGAPMPTGHSSHATSGVQITNPSTLVSTPK